MMLEKRFLNKISTMHKQNTEKKRKKSSEDLKIKMF